MTGMVLGIDEAGRGCVIGDMVVAGVLIKFNYLNELKSLGVGDSKKIGRKKREMLFYEILARSEKIWIYRFSPIIINTNNLNLLTIQAIKEIVLDAQTYYNIEKIRIDIVGNGKEIYNCLKETKAEIIVEKKADEKFVEVSCASIIAKVIRDMLIDKLKRIFGDFGSGYPADTKTIMWLKYSVNLPEKSEIIRFKWNTLNKVMKLGNESTSRSKGKVD